MAQLDESDYLTPDEVRQTLWFARLRDFAQRRAYTGLYDMGVWGQAREFCPPVWDAYSRYCAFEKANREAGGQIYQQTLTSKLAEWMFGSEEWESLRRENHRLSKEVESIEAKLIAEIDKASSMFDNFKRMRAAEWHVQCSTLDGLKAISPQQFERRIATLFEQIGAKTKVTRASGDAGVDVEIHFKGADYAVQCKRFIDCAVGRPDCQRLIGAVIGGRYAGGVIVTTHTLTKHARDYCEQNGLGYIDGPQLAGYIRASAPAGLYKVLKGLRDPPSVARR